MSGLLSRVLVIYKKSTFEQYKQHGDAALQRFIESGHPDAAKMRQSHADQGKSYASILQTLERMGIPYDAAYRGDLPSLDMSEIALRTLPTSALSKKAISEHAQEHAPPFRAGVLDMRKYSLGLVSGGDGTFLDVSHYVSGLPLLGVNSDSSRSVGFYCSANDRTLEGHLADIAAAPRTALSRMRLHINGKELPEQVLNDVLIAHANPAATSKYEFTADGTLFTPKKNSGLLVAAPGGTSAFIWEEGGYLLPFDAEQFEYHVRGVRSEIGSFGRAQNILVRSQMREGVAFVDGEHLRYDLGLGSELQISAGDPLAIIGDLNEKRKSYGNAYP